MTIKFHPINDPHLHGFWAKQHHRAVEVVRVDPWTWECFCTINEHICKTPRNNQHDRKFASESEAKAWARSFLNLEFNLETWPATRVIGDEDHGS